MDKMDERAAHQGRLFRSSGALPGGLPGAMIQFRDNKCLLPKEAPEERDF